MRVSHITARQPLSSECLDACIDSAGLLAQCPVELPATHTLVNTCQALQQPAVAMVIAASTAASTEQLQVSDRPSHEYT